MFSQPGSAVFVPDGGAPATVLGRTTHLGVGAHADDLEIMAIHGILACYEHAERSFTGVVVTDGVGSPEGAPPLAASDLREVRRREQERAAVLGKYGAVALLDHTSASVKDPAARAVVSDLVVALRATRPEVVYTHALSDVHDTHVAVALRLLAACRELSPEERPARVLGCEVWGDLDWLTPADKVVLPLDEREELQLELIAVFASQLDGKSYDRATLGRRHANAGFAQIRSADRHRSVCHAMDLTPLVAEGASEAEFVRGLVGRFESEALGRIAGFAL